jgi:hypothetical protein
MKTNAQQDLNLSIVRTMTIMVACILLQFTNCFAQAPQGISYQAVARDGGGNALANTLICLQSSITNGNGGSTLYSENFNVTTNQLGLFTITIGGGNPNIGTFAGINWGTVSPWHVMEIKINCQGNFILMGSSQMLTVPYAFNAASSADNRWTETGTNIYNSNSGNVGVGTSTPSPSAKVDISSTSSGFLIPRMSVAQRNAIPNPATGLQIINSDNNCLETFNGNGWMSFCNNGIFYNGAPMTQSTNMVWKNKADFTDARTKAVAFSIGTKGYVGTGNSGGLKKDFWEYDNVTNSWTQKADFGGTARMSAVGFSIGTKGYIGTGDDGSQRKDFWEYNTTLNAWTAKTDFGGTARNGAVGFAIGGKGYIGTGFDGSPFNVYKDFWEYDPVNDSWTQKLDFGGAERFWAVGFSVGGKGYIGTGMAFPIGDSKDFWEYNPSLNTWTQKADFTFGNGTSGAVAFAMGGKGYLGTGDFSPTDFYEYDANIDTWTKKENFGGAGRSFAVGFSIGNKGYIGTGGKKDWWEYPQ